MANLPGRYFGDRDISFINGINNELLGDIIQTEVTLFKMCGDQTTINIYGESKPSVGKQYYPGIDVVCLIKRADIDTTNDDFGPTRSQNCIFTFLEKDLESVNFFPQNGDLILFNDRYYQADNIVQENFLGGQPSKSFSIIVHTFYTSLSSIDMVERQS